MTVFNAVTTAAVCLVCALCGYKMIKKSPLPERSRGAVAVDKFCDKYAPLILALIFALAVFTRFYKLTEIPYGVNVDEAAAAYSAFTLKEYGVDRYLNPYPVYFINFHSGQSALYIWLTALVYEIADVTSYNLFAIRFSTALFSSLAVIFSYFLFHNLLGSKRGALLGSSITAVTPVYIMTGRFGLDCFLLLPFFTLSMMCLSFALKRDGVLWYVLSGIALGVTLYSYAVSYVVIPIFLFFLLQSLLICKKVRFSQVIALGVPLFLLALPLMLFIGINAGFLKLETVPSFIPMLERYRGSDVSFANALQNLRMLSTIFTTDGLNFSSVPVYYTLYLFSVPLSVFGIICSAADSIKALKTKSFFSGLLPLCALAGCLLTYLMVNTPLVYKSTAFYPCLVFFIVRAATELERRLGVILESAAALFAVYFALFSNFYFNRYNDEYELQLFARDAIEAYSYVRESRPDDTLYLSLSVRESVFDFGHVYTLLADFEDPYFFSESDHDEYTVDCYGNNKFYFPVMAIDGELVYDEIDYDGVYLIYQLGTETFDYMNEYLESFGFEYEEYLNYRIYTHEGG